MAVRHLEVYLYLYSLPPAFYPLAATITIKIDGIYHTDQNTLEAIYSRLLSAWFDIRLNLVSRDGSVYAYTH